VLHRHALAILGLVEESRRAVIAAAGHESESVRLGLTPALMLVLGAEIAVMARDRLPHVFLSLSEAMSHVLAETLLRGDLDMALGYDLPETPRLERTALLEEDLVFVTLPIEEAAESIPFADVIEEVLILPEQGDTVRTRVTQAAQAIGAQPNIAFEVRSVPAMKSLILRGAGAGVLPYGAVLAEVGEKRLLARRVTAPALRRTLYLAVRTGAASPRNAVGLRALIRESLGELIATLGPLAHPLASAE
jgi:LysR family nitrogen assimilation transcriptional regulator